MKPNPAWQDPIYLLELAIKRCVGKPEFENLQTQLELVLRKTKQELMAEMLKKASEPVDESDIPF